MLFYPESFKVSTPGDREILVERDFNAPRGLVFDAFTEPELVRRWLLGPEGWTMPVCDIDLSVGGAYRYVWRNESTGEQMGMGGVFREVVRPARLVATEKFDDAWYPGEAVDTTGFASRPRGITHVTVNVLYQSKEARDTASRSGMEYGMAAGYTRLEELLSHTAAEANALERIDTPEIADTPSQLTAAISMEVPPSQIRSAMTSGRDELLAAVKGQGIGPTGPLFDHYRKVNSEIFDFDICVPVSTPVAATGRVVSREVPALKVARTVYRGPYEQLPDAWREFDGWIRANGHVPAPDLYQCYSVGPEASSNPADWKTELRRPLLAQA